MKDRDYVHRNFGGQCSQGDIAPYVIVTGSKGRVLEIASYFDEYKQVADDYEYLICTGSLNGYPITACSTGIGGMSVSIAIEELANLGAKTILRIGVTGPINNEFDYADLIIAKGAVRWDGTSHDYVMPEYPAIAHFEVLMASILSAKELGYPYKTGIIADLASLGPLSNEGYRSFLSNNTKAMHDQLINAGVLNGTGEASTMLVQSSIYNIRSGVININLQDPTNQTWNPAEDYRVVNCGVKTISILQQWDNHNSTQNIKHTVPSI
jgi:uridine phosphorylase|tara:strand:- start:498 stop:1298 length:801 start_codon:yes stop_codon:yes gene_type:complete